MKNKKVLAIDCDEVISETTDSFIDFCNAETNYKFSRSMFKTYNHEKDLGISSSEVSKLYIDFYNSKYLISSSQVEGAKKALEILSKDNELILVTARHESVRKQTQEWLDKNFPKLFSNMYFSKNDYSDFGTMTKSEICEDIGASMLIDDHYGYLKDCNADMDLFLLNKPWNEKLEIGSKVSRVDSWGEVLNSLGY